MKEEVTQDFLDAQNNDTIQYFYEVKMYRRYWSEGAYVYEETGTDIKPYILTKSNVNWQLDTEGLNIWRVSNVQLELKNNYGEFNEGSGKFFTSTYERFKTKIVIKIGYVLPDDTTEIVYSFTGILIDDVVTNQSTQSIIFSLSGKEILTTLANAENVCNIVTDETLGTGALINEFWTQNKNVLSIDSVYINAVLVSAADYTVTGLYNVYHGAKIVFDTAPALEDVITVDYKYGNNEIITGEQIGTGVLNNIFYTDYKGVGKINAVYLDNETLDTIDYSVENFNDINNYGKIVFPVGVGVGQIVKCDYQHWYKDVAIETIIGYLLDEAEFVVGQRTIGSIDVGSFYKYEIWNTKTDWDDQNNTRNVDSDTNIGSVAVNIENFVDDIATNDDITISGSYPSQVATITSLNWTNKYEAVALPEASSPAWTKTANEGTEEINPADILHLNVPTGASKTIYYTRDFANCYSAKVKLKIVPDSDYVAHHFSIWLGGTYYIHITRAIGTWVLTLHNGISGNGYDTGLTELNWSDYHTIRFNYSTIEEKIYLYFDDVLITSQSWSYGAPTSIGFGVFSPLATQQAGDVWVDYFYYDDHNPSDGVLISDSLNLGVVSPVIANLGTMLRTWLDPGDGSTLTIKIQTSGTSDFSSDNDIWRDVSFVGNVGTISASTVSKRYIRWCAILHAALAISPELYLISMPAHLFTDSVDCGVNLDIYNIFSLIKVDYDGVIKIYSQSSADESTWEAEVEIVSGVIASTKQRYIRFRTVIYITSDGDSPVIQKEYFTYKITSLNVAMADFTGMSVQTALEEFAKLLDYEIGVDSEGKYFFRAKNESAVIDMELSDSINIEAIDNINAGWERIYNDIKVNVGNFNIEMSPITEAESEPHSITKYGVRELNIESSGIKIDDNLDLSSGLVEIYYNRYKLPKKEIRLQCKMLPQLELSDTVNVNWLSVSWYWFWGDTRQYWGKPGLIWFSQAMFENMIPVYNLVSNVVGLELDLTEWKLFVNIREI